MINDISTVLWKEARELLFQRPNLRGGWFGLLIFIGVFGIFLPLQWGAAWVQSPVNLVYWSWIPFMMVSSVVADSFAGERERHTLETLLASRLPDRAILSGKLLLAIAYGWGLTLISVLLGLVTVNIAFGQGRLLLYPVDIAAGIAGISFLVSALASGLGVLISLHAASVRSAQQTLSLATLSPLVVVLALPMLPEAWKAAAMDLLANINLTAAVVTLMGFLLILDLGLLLVGMKRFQRARMILD